MKIFSNKNTQAGQLDFSRLPRHIAVIMDGNGRWARKRGLPRTAGHAAGAETFRRVATYCKSIGIEYLTVYAFSTENWSRPADEVKAIMDILEKYLGEAIETMERDRVKMKFFGDITFLSPKLQKLIAETERISERFEGVQVNMCVNYGGRDDIMRAARAYAQDYKESGARLTKTDSRGIFFPPACRIPILSYGPAEKCGYPIFFYGSRLIPSYILRTFYGLISTRVSLTAPSLPIRAESAVTGE